MLIDYDKIIMLSHPIQLTIRIQTTSRGGLAQFGFNSNRLNANSMWTRSIRINRIQCTLFSSCRQQALQVLRQTCHQSYGLHVHSVPPLSLQVHLGKL